MGVVRLIGTSVSIGALALLMASKSVAVPITPGDASGLAGGSSAEMRELLTSYSSISQSGGGAYDVRQFVGAARAAVRIARAGGGLQSAGAGSSAGWLNNAFGRETTAESIVAAFSLVGSQEDEGPFTPQPGDGILGDNGEPIFTVDSGGDPSGVPLPPTLLMLASGAVFLMLGSRRRAKPAS